MDGTIGVGFADGRGKVTSKVASTGLTVSCWKEEAGYNDSFDAGH